MKTAGPTYITESLTAQSTSKIYGYMAHPDSSAYPTGIQAFHRRATLATVNPEEQVPIQKLITQTQTDCDSQKFTKHPVVSGMRPRNKVGS